MKTTKGRNSSRQSSGPSDHDSTSPGYPGAYLIYALISTAIAIAVLCAYAASYAKAVNSFDPMQGRMFEIYKGIAHADYWPETLGRIKFYRTAPATMLLLGPICNYVMIVPLGRLFGVTATTILMCNIFLAAGNFCGIAPLYGSCKTLGIAPRTAFILAASLLLNPFFLLKLSWDPLMSFGIPTVLFAYYALRRGAPAVWMVLVAVVALEHPIGLFTSAAWYFAELLLGEKEHRKWAVAGLGLLAAVAAYRAATMGIELHFFRDRSWLHHEFGNASNSLLPLLLHGKWRPLYSLLLHNMAGLALFALCAGFFMATSKKYLIALAPEIVYLFLGIDSVENGCIPTFVGLVLAGMIDGLACGSIAKRRLARAAPAISLAGAGITLLLFSFGNFSSSDIFTARLASAPAISEQRRAVIKEAAMTIHPEGSTCITNPQITTFLSEFCGNTISLRTLFPIDLKSNRFIVSPLGLKPDWLLVDTGMLNEASPSISGAKDDTRFIASRTKEILAGGEYDLVFGENGVVVYRKKIELPAGSP